MQSSPAPQPKDQPRNRISPVWLAIPLLLLVYLPFVGKSAQYALKAHGDFATLYSAAIVTFHEGRSPFPENAFAGLAMALGGGIYPYLYPPPSLITVFPLSVLSYETARAAMFITNHACLLFFGYLLFWRILRLRFSDADGGLIITVSAVYLMSFSGIRFELFHGQIDLIVLICLCLTWYALKRDASSLLIALPFSFAILLKTYPVLLLPLLFFRRRYLAIGSVFALLLLYSGIAYSALPSAVWPDWVINVLPTGGYGKTTHNLGSPAFPWNQSINGFTSRLFLSNDFSQPLLPSETLGRIVPYALALTIAGATVAVSYFASRSERSDALIDHEFPVYLLMMFLVAPLAWEQHLVYALPAAIIAMQVAATTVWSRVVRLIVVAALLVLALGVPVDATFLKTGILTLGISVKMYVVVVLWAILLWHVFLGFRGRTSGDPAVGETAAAST